MPESEPLTNTICVRLDAATREIIDRIAKAEDRSPSWLIRTAIAAWIAAHCAEHPSDALPCRSEPD